MPYAEQPEAESADEAAISVLHCNNGWWPVCREGSYCINK